MGLLNLRKSEQVYCIINVLINPRDSSAVFFEVIEVEASLGNSFR